MGHRETEKEQKMVKERERERERVLGEMKIGELKWVLQRNICLGQMDHRKTER